METTWYSELYSEYAKRDKMGGLAGFGTIRLATLYSMLRISELVRTYILYGFIS